VVLHAVDVSPASRIRRQRWPEQLSTAGRDMLQRSIFSWALFFYVMPPLESSLALVLITVLSVLGLVSSRGLIIIRPALESTESLCMHDERDEWTSYQREINFLDWHFRFMLLPATYANLFSFPWCKLTGHGIHKEKRPREVVAWKLKMPCSTLIKGQQPSFCTSRMDHETVRWHNLCIHLWVYLIVEMHILFCNLSCFSCMYLGEDCRSW
jgi:hypothetical protein